MLHLIDPELTFIERTAHGPCHIAHKQNENPRWWVTCCGREWHRDMISELTTRALADNDPDTFVCRACKRNTRDGDIREEPTP